jgi:hypothetical protein
MIVDLNPCRGLHGYADPHTYQFLFYTPDAMHMTKIKDLVARWSDANYPT